MRSGTRIRHQRWRNLCKGQNDTNKSSFTESKDSNETKAKRTQKEPTCLVRAQTQRCTITVQDHHRISGGHTGVPRIHTNLLRKQRSWTCGWSVEASDHSTGFQAVLQVLLSVKTSPPSSPSPDSAPANPRGQQGLSSVAGEHYFLPLIPIHARKLWAQIHSDIEGFFKVTLFFVIWQRLTWETNIFQKEKSH